MPEKLQLSRNNYNKNILNKSLLTITRNKLKTASLKENKLKINIPKTNIPRVNRLLASCLLAIMLIVPGCGNTSSIDDYATNNIESNVTDDITSNVTDGIISDTTVNSQDTEKSQQSSSSSESVKGIPKEDIKIGILYLADPSEGDGYSYTHDLGIQGMQNNLSIPDGQIIRKTNIDDTDNSIAAKAIDECIEEGCNTIFTTSWGYMDITEQKAEQYPDVYFFHGTGYKSNGKNFSNYFGRIYQARYLSGIVAGMNTKSNKIGYVAAMDSSNSEVTGGIDAFAIGVAAVNPDAVIYVKVTNSWYDPVKEKSASRKLLDMGCDVMAQHCDTPYPQTMAQERGCYGIGYNSDMEKDTPDSCLCSVIWNWSAYYTSVVESIIDGTYNGENYYGGMEEGLVDITRLADFCVEGTEEKVAEERAKILSGEFNVFDGEIETNTGEIVGSQGSTLDDGTITGGINWYYKNVKVAD